MAYIRTLFNSAALEQLLQLWVYNRTPKELKKQNKTKQNKTVPIPYVRLNQIAYYGPGVDNFEKASWMILMCCQVWK